MNGRSIARSALAKPLRPVLAALDRRLEVLAARLERHTERLAVDQRTEIRRIDERLTLDVAVMSEHLVGIERIARRVAEAPSTAMPAQILLALPGEPLRLPTGVEPSAVTAFAVDGTGVWSAVAGRDESTLRIVALPARTAT